MNLRHPLLLLVLASASCASVPALPTPPTSTRVIAFTHANVIPMDANHVLRDHTVLVADGRIVEVGASGNVSVPAGALRVDATGRYLLPALCDMHVHLLGETWNMMLPAEARLPARDMPYERFLLPYIANGVTTVLALSGTAEDIAVRKRIESGELLGPRMILAPMVDGPDKAWPPPISTWVRSPDEARAAVRRAKAEGYDRIKAYSFLDKASYDAIVETAHQLDIGVIGHVPYALSVEYVLDAGQGLIAHSEEVAKHAQGNFSAERVAYYADLLARRGTWLIPTLVTTESILEVFDSSAALLARPEAAYFRHPLEQGVWTFIAEKLYQPIPTDARELLRRAFVQFQRPLTRAIYEKGGRLLAGSDTPLPGLVPGFALHRELRELVGVGLTPFAALRTATTAPFEYLGESDRAGTIQVGKYSDLVLLDANPLEDIAAVGRISGVLMRGRWLPGPELRDRLQQP